MSDFRFGPSSDQVVAMRYDTDKKNLLVAYALWFFVGIFGAHRFYLGYRRSAIAMLVTSILGCLLSVIFIGFLLLLVTGIWAIVDAFKIPAWVAEQNHALIEKLSR